MSVNKSDCDVAVAVGAFLVFALPLTLLIPDFSIWDVVPKIRVTRFHILSQHLTWPQLNAALIGLLTFFFCLCLEIRRRKLDDMVETVLDINQVTDATMEMDKEGHIAAMRVCAKLLDSSSEHYEHLMLFRDELRRRDEAMKQRPPTIEPSDSVCNQLS